MGDCENPFYNSDNVNSVVVDPMVVEAFLPLSIVVDPIRDGVAEYSEVGHSDNGNIDAGGSVGYLEALSPEHENPSDKTSWEGTDIIVPSVGMKFKDEVEVFEFYKNYAYEDGFPVRKRNSKKGDDRVVRYVSFTCSREGRRNIGTNTVLKPQPTIQTGCKARLTTCSELNRIWRINTVHLEHNHRISPSKMHKDRDSTSFNAQDVQLKNTPHHNHQQVGTQESVAGYGFRM